MVVTNVTSSIPNWKVEGDWFDVCKCSIPCPCEFAQSPTFGDCDGNYGETTLDGLNALALGAFKGNIWAGETKITLGFYFDERADEKQRDALQMIFSGKVGGFMAELGKLIGDVRGIDFAPIKIEVADDLSYWTAEIPGKVNARGEALTGPMTPPGKRVQTTNPPGSEAGPGVIATWGTAVKDEADGMGFKWKRMGRSSKYIPFDWSGQ